MTERNRGMVRTVSWVVLALAGLMVTAALAIATSRLTVERVGLAGEPAAAGRHLAPADDPRTTTPPAHHEPLHEAGQHGDGDGDRDD
jgi:hypothetical protein